MSAATSKPESSSAGADLPTSPGHSLTEIAVDTEGGRSRAAARLDIRRRVTYLMLTRVVIITLVMGSTIAVAAVNRSDLTSPSSLFLLGIVGATYALTIAYAIAVPRVDPVRLGYIQLAGDLVITAGLVHLTGGAQSAYTFFFSLSIIGGAALRFRAGAITVTVASVVLYLAVSLAGWAHLLPVPAGQRVLPSDLSPTELARWLGLNVAAFGAIGLLAYGLGAQLQRASAVVERHRAQAADLLTLHEDIVRSLTSGLVTVDVDDRILTLNQAACDILGVLPASVTGRSIDDILPGVGAKLAPLRRRDLLRRAEITLERAGRPDIILGISVSPLVDSRDVALGRVLNFQDLTELRGLEIQYKQAERLAAIGSLAAGIAHEIRNPLASISGSVELLTGAPDADPDSGALMEIVTREIDRLNGLVGDLLDYTNPRPRELVAFDLAELVAETLQVFRQDRGFAGVNVELADGAAVTGLPVVADPEKLRQVVWNLVRNAAEASIGHNGAGAARVTVDAARIGKRAQITVEDNGPGIAGEDLERVFDPFFTTKKRGSGLGLATTQSIVHEHGGSIRAESAPRAGSRFLVTLPLSDSDALPSHSGDRSGPAQAYTGEHE